MLTIMAAAALALPDAGQDFNRSVEREVPREVLKTNVAGIWYQAFVDADGTITKCTVRGILGDTNKAAKACEAVKGKRIEPARVDGRPVYGVYRGAIVLTESSFRPENAVFEADVVLEVQSLPNASRGPVRTDLAVLVGPDGRISSCQYRGGTNSGFAKVACEQAKEVQLPVGRSIGGEAVEYVYPMSFEFTESLAAR